MIIIYPMLVSKSISKVAIPGIIKVLENYILIYEIDHVMASARQSGGMMSASKYKIKRGKVTIKEGDILTEDVNDRLRDDIQDFCDKGYNPRKGNKGWDLKPNSLKHADIPPIQRRIDDVELFRQRAIRSKDKEMEKFADTLYNHLGDALGSIAPPGNKWTPKDYSASEVDKINQLSSLNYTSPGSIDERKKESLIKKLNY